jgi:hypothetical protein
MYAYDGFAVERMPYFLGDGQEDRGELNDADNTELRALVEEWLRANANWPRFLERMLRAKKPVPFTKGEFYIQTSEPPVLVPMPAKGGTLAHGIFLQFILHPDRGQLAGPCNCGCGRYFLKRTAHPKIFADGHAQRATALKSAKDTRDNFRKERIGMAKEAIAKYERDRKQGDWKIFVEIETGITLRTLAGWLRKGYINAPVGRKGNA